MKHALFTFVAVLTLVALAQAVPIPQEGSVPLPPRGGWGMECEDYVTMSNPWQSGEAIYNPLIGSGGLGFVLCPNCTEGIAWPALDIELWIEMECNFTWDNTSADIHLASYYDDVCLYFNGTSACNNGQYIIVNPPPGQSLDVLPFVADMFGRTGPDYGTDIPVAWEASVDGGPYTVMQNLTGADAGSKYFLVPKCNHFYTIKACLDIVYHQEDGYYTWARGGFLCPANPM